MTAGARYLQELRRRLELLETVEAEAIETAARLCEESIAAGGVVHVFGSGHSQLAALEARVRAGGLACVDVVADAALSPSQPRRAGLLEQVPGYAATLLATSDLRAGEVVFVISNSGINAVPVEFAAGCADLGLTVIAVTSRAHAAAVPSRAPSGQKLVDVADLVIDTHGPAGDATLPIGSGPPSGGVSTVLAAAALTAVLVRAAERLDDAGIVPPVLGSQNLEGHGVDNDALLARYAHRTGIA